MLEVVLGLDNIFSFAMLINQAPLTSRKFTKTIALSGSFILRLALLGFALAIQDTHCTLIVLGFSWAVKESCLFFGGLFLSVKALNELKQAIRGFQGHPKNETLSLSWIVIEIIFIDMVFAIDSVLAAVAITQNATVIISSIFSSIIFMYFAADFVIKYMQESWRFNILGVILILIIGVSLMAKGVGFECDQNIVLSLIIFGCLYEGLMTSLEYWRKNLNPLP
jgi:predicted tellurium resistance membrane protein TerC